MTFKAIYRHTTIAAIAVMVMACTSSAGPSAPASVPVVQASSLVALPDGFPIGSWTSTITEEDLRKAGVTDAGLIKENTGAFTTTFASDGTWSTAQTTDAPIRWPLFRGTFEVAGDGLIDQTTTFPPDYAGDVVRLTWRMENGTLVLGVPEPPDPFLRMLTEMHHGSRPSDAPQVTTTLPRPARLALLPLGIAFGLGAEIARLQAGWPLIWVVADLVPGLAFLVCGEIAWERRPGNRVGPLMVAIAFAWYVGTYGAIAEPAISETAHAFQGYYDALLAWLILAYPSGRLASRSSRAVVGALFGVLAVRTVFRIAIIRPTTEYGDLTDPAVADRYVSDVTLRADGDAVFSTIIAILAIAVVVLVIGRWRAQTAVGRRVAGPILLGGLAFAIGIVVEYATAFVPTTNIFDRIAIDDLGQYLTVATATLMPIGFLVGLTRARIARGGVADLVLQLGSKPDQPTLREVLAKTLGDPSLEVAYAVPGTADFVDRDGHALTIPSTSSAGRAVTRLERDGRVDRRAHPRSGAHGTAGAPGIGIAATRLALDNERLAAEVRAQLEDVRASRARIVVAGDEGRRRVERDLHDGAQQRLVTLALALQVARSQASRSDPALPGTLERATAELELALAELRELARGLHPTVLVEDGLAAAVESLADRSPVPVTIRVPDRNSPPALEATAYFVVAEGLTNVAKYAEATGARVDIDQRDGVLVIEVADDGVGGADPGHGSGIRGLDDRVAAAGGRFSLTSLPGQGTTLRADIPCA